MAKKTNVNKNGYKYFRTSLSLGRNAEGKVEVKEFYGKTKKEAEEKKMDYRENLRKGYSINYDNVKFGLAMKQWIYDVILLSNRSKSTIDRYEGIFRNYIEESKVSKLSFTDLNSSVLQVFYKELLDDGKTLSSVKYVHRLIKMFLDYAVDEGFIIRNFANSKHISIVGKGKECNKVDVFSDDELELIREELKGHHLEAIIILALGSGLRISEIIGLKWIDIDFESSVLSVKRIIRVNKHISQNGSYSYMREEQLPKSKSSIRTVSLPSSVLTVLNEHKIKQSSQIDKGLVNDENYVFVTHSGEPLNSRNLLRAYKRFLNQIGLRIRPFHVTRHTYATKLFENDVPLKTVQTLLGHSDISITANIYTHVSTEKLHDAVAVMDRYFSNEKVGEANE